MLPGRIFALALCCYLSTACEPADPPSRAVRTRASRFGVLRDLVLFPRSPAQGGPFFLDRFETTQADWERYLETEDPEGLLRARFEVWQKSFDPSLPVAGIDLHEARRYARWRFGRLPRLDEWRWAVTAGGKYRFPWGDREFEGRANAASLRLPGLTPVGAFESGRHGDRPYDLLGNVSEWTETIRIDWSDYVPDETPRDSWLVHFIADFDHCETISDVLEELVLQIGWPGIRLRIALELNYGQGREGFFDRGLSALTELMSPEKDALSVIRSAPEAAAYSAHEPNLLVAREVLRHTPGLAVWHHGYLPVPLLWWLAADGLDQFGHFCVGQMGQSISASEANLLDPQVGVSLPGERSFRRGLRVAVEPDLLLARLLREEGALDDESLTLLRSFLRLHRDVLISAARRLPEFETATGPIADAMREEFSQ